MLAVGVLGSASACHGILDTTNPLLIRNGDLANAAGAEGRRVAFLQFWQQNGYYDFMRMATLLSDEETYDNGDPGYYPGDQAWVIDARDTAGMLQVDPSDDQVLRGITQSYWLSTLAINALKQYGDPTFKEDYLTETYALRGQIVLTMAENICPGFPLNDVDPENRPIYGTQLTRDSALKFAIAQLDSALAHGKDSAQFLDLARVLKGRALLDLGQYAAAATAVQPVADNFVFSLEMLAGESNPFYYEYATTDHGFNSYAVGDHEGGNGLGFVSEHDSIRVPTIFAAYRLTAPTLPLYAQALYTTQSAPIPIATGLEARLIRAEAAYQANDPSWFAMLNALRSERGIDPIPAVPTTDTGKVNFIFHERAFWLFRTGHRLGDMRRLVLNYARNPETVYPTGDYPIAGLKYGNATALPFSYDVQHQYNPNVTHGCTTP